MRNPDCINFRDVALLADIYAYSKAEIAAAQEHVETCLDCQKYAVEILEKWKRLGGGLKYTPKAQAEPICPVCGGWYSMAEMKCLKCGYGVFVTVMEYDAADVRAMIAAATADPRTAAQKDADLFDAEVKQTYSMI